jgi:hypothetical protein
VGGIRNLEKVAEEVLWEMGLTREARNNEIFVITPNYPYQLGPWLKNFLLP